VVEIALDITGIAHGGVSVARHEGKVVFVADTLPGERVLARIIEDKRSYARAVAIDVIAPSPDRVPHVWPEAAIERDPAERAGGAEFGHIRLEHQRELKREVFVDALRRFAHVERDVVVEAVPGDDEVGGLRWRTRVSLHVDEGGTPGPYAARSHRVVPVTDLPLADAAISSVLQERFAGEERIEVIATPSGLRLVIGDQQPSVVTERAAGREFQVDDTGFWQVHRAAPDILHAATRDAIDPEAFDPNAENLDLYGGVGLLATAIADLGGPSTRVTTIESDARASQHAGTNLADLPEAEAVHARVDRWIADVARRGERFDGATIVLDPPRTGAGRDVAAALTQLGASQLVYVACDPVALARDTGAIIAGGYELTRLRAFDLFPHTHHLESIATFVRR